MVDETTIQAAKAVDVNLILDEFGWERNKYGQIRCPHPAHNDRTPSCSYSASSNKFKCFGCGESFDTIDLYRCLAEKTNGRAVPFHKAVEEVLGLDANNSSVGLKGSNQMKSNYSSASQSQVYQGSASQQASYQAGNSNINQQTKACQPVKNTSPYEMIINNSKPLTGYELNYLHKRGIMLYDSYVYKGEVHTAQNIEKALQTETDQNEINRLNEIKSNGTFYKGIAPILKANQIQINHNYWQGTNSIIYLTDYDADSDDNLCCEHFFRDTKRRMAVQKTMDSSHIKRALGTSDFNFITQGIECSNNDIYICEGIEDALSCAMNGICSISLNSIANLRSLTHFLSEDYFPCYNERFVICFDHDEAGRKATQELKDFFEAYKPKPPRKRRYDYAVCNYPQQFHDLNDYWISKVFH